MCVMEQILNMNIEKDERLGLEPGKNPTFVEEVVIYALEDRRICKGSDRVCKEP